LISHSCCSSADRRRTSCFLSFWNSSNKRSSSRLYSASRRRCSSISFLRFLYYCEDKH
jgi:hypothetical protein